MRDSMKKRVTELFRAGRIEHLSGAELDKMDNKHAREKIRAAENVEAGAYEVLGESQARRLLEAVDNKSLPFLKKDDVPCLTREKAEDLIRMAEMADRRPSRKDMLERVKAHMRRGYARQTEDRKPEGLSDHEIRRMLEKATRRYHDRMVVDGRNGKEARLA